MNCNNKAEIAKLLGKSKEFAECLRTRIMTRHDIWYAFNFMIMKNLEYPMAVTTITESEWNKIMSPLMAEALPASGMTQKYSNSPSSKSTSVSSIMDYTQPYHEDTRKYVFIWCTQSSTTGDTNLVSWQEVI